MGIYRRVVGRILNKSFQKGNVENNLRSERFGVTDVRSDQKLYRILQMNREQYLQDITLSSECYPGKAAGGRRSKNAYIRKVNRQHLRLTMKAIKSCNDMSSCQIIRVTHLSDRHRTARASAF